LEGASHHHLGITVDDIEPVYRAAERRGNVERAVHRAGPTSIHDRIVDIN
jgi:hypothetical protein